jgi:hypothetical protein
METLKTFYEGGPETWNEAFPPICVKSHWDPTMVTSHILPTVQRNLAEDPRPSTKICTSYYNTSMGDAGIPDSYEDKPLNIPSAFLGGFKRPVSENAKSSTVMPPGGSASLGFPFSVYQQRVNQESDVLRLNEPLTRCAEKRYIPNGGLPAPTTSTNKIPDADISQSSLLSPLATFVKTQAGCRNEDDQESWNRSARLFFNPTRYDRTKNVPAGTFVAPSGAALYCPQWMKQ